MGADGSRNVPEPDDSDMNLDELFEGTAEPSAGTTDEQNPMATKPNAAMAGTEDAAVDSPTEEVPGPPADKASGKLRQERIVDGA